VGLTAFTLVALMEAGLNRDAEIVDRGFAFLADIRPTSGLSRFVRNFPCQTLKISKVSLVVMGS
jgi:hypothetical protein